ncbi:sensor histidine kinase [Streptomyces sp. 4N509B]|uniref:sensor histidine kinase n=1 Tax=Streptomyces sp. 4N509B TaxID=3457413 RepID=UPI003FD551AB
MRSVRGRAALGATAVVAAVLVAAGLLMLVTLRQTLDDQVDLQAELNAREVATELATRTRNVAGQELDGANPVQVLNGDGELVAVSEGLEEITGTASGQVVPRQGGLEAAENPRPPRETETEAPAGGGADARPGAGGDSNGEDGDSGDDSDDDDDGDDDSDSDDDSDDDSDGGDDGERQELSQSDGGDDDGGDDDGGDDDGGDDDGGDDGDGGSGGDQQDPLSPGEVDSEPAAMATGTAVVDGQHGEYRFAIVRARTTNGQDVTVYAGAPLEVERAALDSVRTSMLVGIPVLLAVVAGVTWLVTRRALRPVEGIRQEMAAITRSQDLSRRVPEPGSRDEIGRLAQTTNETLTALEASVERQRRFVADASHELRSPIASLRTQLEVGEAHPELLDVPGAVQDTIRLQDLAADLLLLARLDAGERPAAAPVDLTRLVAEEVARRGAEPGGEAGGVAVRAGEMAESVRVSGSRGQLLRVLGNLLDNGRRHAASTVRVSVRREEAGADGGADAGTAVVEVADDGAGVPEADRERIFERFVRLDDARSRDDGGAGLGLAIARDVAGRHGGSLTVSRAPEGGALFVLRLPATP